MKLGQKSILHVTLEKFPSVFIIIFTQNKDMEDKSVEVDFAWLRNVMSEGKIFQPGLTREPEERSSDPKFLLLDVRRFPKMDIML